jgi:hypothetical protein
MGKGGIFDSRWTTIILAVVLIVLAVIVVWVFKTGGLDKFKVKPSTAIKSPTSMYINPQVHSDRLIAIADLSWKEKA